MKRRTGKNKCEEEPERREWEHEGNTSALNCRKLNIFGSELVSACVQVWLEKGIVVVVPGSFGVSPSDQGMEGGCEGITPTTSPSLSFSPAVNLSPPSISVCSSHTV